MNDRELSMEAKSRILEQALKTPAGRSEIGQTLLEPFKLGRDYKAIGRQVLAVDILPIAVPMWYDKDPQFSAVSLAQNGNVPYEEIEATRIELEPFIITAWVKVPALEVAIRRFAMLDRAQEKGHIEMAKEEDRKVFSAIKYAATNATNHNTVVTSNAGLTRGTLTDLFLEIEKWNAPVANILMAPAQFRDIRNWSRHELDPVTQYELLRTGYVGDIWNSRIRTSFLVEEGNVYAVAEPQYCGVISVRVDLSVWEAPDPQNVEYGWLLFEYLGIAIVVAQGVAAATITGKVT